MTRSLKMQLHHIILRVLKRINRLWLNQNIRAKISVAFGISTLVLAIALSEIVGYGVQTELQNNRGQLLTTAAQQMADKLDRGMFERYRDIQILATLSQFRNPQTPPLERRELLEKLKATYTDYAWIAFTNPTGVVQVATGGLLEGKDISERPVFANALKQPFVGNVHEAVLLAKLLPNPSDEPLRFLDVSTPVVDSQGELQGVLVAHVSWAWARDLESSLIDASQDWSETTLFIVNQDGTVSLNPRSINPPFQTLDLPSSQAARQGQRDHQVETWTDGKTYLTGFAPTQGYRDYRGLGWVVLVRQSTQVAFAPARALQQQIFLLGLALGGLFVAVGWMIAGQIVQPMSKLTKAVDCFSQGDRTVQIPQFQARDEVSHLAQAIANLIETLATQEQALLTANLSLEQRVQDRTTELNQLNSSLAAEINEKKSAEHQLQILTDELQRSNQELEQFAYVASHDLQEPLRTIASYTELLARKYNGQLDEKADRYIHYVTDGAVRMQQLINDLLSYSRIGKQSLKLENINCQELIQRVSKNLETAIADAQATFTYDAPEAIVADQRQLTQLLQNLIGNAIKYRGDRPPTVHLSISHQANHWLFAIRDNGIGIEPQYLERIFLIFQRLHTRREYSGTGVGLAICKKIVEQHGGEIWVESKFGEGSTFYFTLPISSSNPT